MAQLDSSSPFIPDPKLRISRWRWWHGVLFVLLIVIIWFGVAVGLRVYRGVSGQQREQQNPLAQTPFASDPNKVPGVNTPMRGSPEAPVTIVEFGDFECPYCQASFPVVLQMLSDYPEQIKLVFRHYPLTTIHPFARAAAEAAACAEVQGKFWPYHDQLYMHPANLDEAGLVAAATATGLDVMKWQQCRALGIGARRVDSDMADARALGVHGTPTWFINNHEIEGALNTSQFRALIEGALQLVLTP